MSVLISLMSCTVHLIISNCDFNRAVQSLEHNFIIYISRRKAEMEVAICPTGVLEVVVTRHILQRPGRSDYNLRTPLEKDMFNYNR